MKDPSNRDLPLNPDNLYYLSLHQDSVQHEYGKKRVEQDLVQLWLDGKLKTGKRRDPTPPDLTPEEIACVPGGSAAMGNLQSLKLDACVVRQSKIEVLQDDIRYFQSIPDGYCDEFNILMQQHNDEYTNMLVGLSSAGGGTPNSAPAEDNDSDNAPLVTGASFQTLDELKGALTLLGQVKAGTGNVDVIVGKQDNKVRTFLVCKEEKIIPKHTHLGSFGQGMWQKADAGSVGVTYEFPLGDKTLVQFDSSSIDPTKDKVEVMTLYALLTMLEKSGLMVEHKVSMASVERKQEGNKDTSVVKVPEK